MDIRTRRVLEAPLLPTLARMAVPNVVVMVVQTSIGLIETYFVAGLGTDALAGMALVFPVVMLVQMLSAGGMGGGIQSAVSRNLGAGRLAEAGLIAWHAAAIGLGLGVVTSLLALPLGPGLYALMGGTGGSLEAATAYAKVVFGGAILIWLFNALSAVIRGTGNMALPAGVTCVGALVLIPLSPALIFGWGPFPKLGVVGGGVAFAGYYAAGSAVFAAYIWSGRGVLHPSRGLPRLAWTPSREILRIGLLSGIASMTSNVTVIAATGFVGTAGPAALAGYGTGTRLEYLLVPLVFGLGSPIAALVGTALGAGDHARARQAALTGAIAAGVLTEAIGLAAALYPASWLGLFGGRSGDARHGRLLPPHRRAVLRVFRGWPRSLLRRPRCRSRRLAAHREPSPDGRGAGRSLGRGIARSRSAGDVRCSGGRVRHHGPRQRDGLRGGQDDPDQGCPRDASCVPDPRVGSGPRTPGRVVRTGAGAHDLTRGVVTTRCRQEAEGPIPGTGSTRQRVA